MSENAPGVTYASFVKMISRAPTSAAKVANLGNYLTKHGTVTLERSERYLGAPLATEDLPQMAEDWENQAGVHPDFVRADGTRRPIATHIVVSLPPEFNASEEGRERAYRTLRAFAHEMFGSGRNGGQWDYFTAFHTHHGCPDLKIGPPHLHICVDRMSHEGRLLKISRRDPFMNYDNMRAVMADVAYRHGIDLDARTRAERGIMERPITSPEHRRQMRDNRAHVAIFPQPESETPATIDPALLPRPFTYDDHRLQVRRAHDGVADTLLDREPILRANPGEARLRRRTAEDAARAMAARLRARDSGAAAAAAARERLEAQRDDDDDFNGPGHDGGDNRDGTVRSPRVRRRAVRQRPNVETRAQAARRHEQEAARRRVDAERRHRERESRRRRLAESPNVETRARLVARLARERMQLRSSRVVEHGPTSPSNANGTQPPRNSRNNNHR